MWRMALDTAAFTAAVGSATEYRQSIVRLFGIPESEIAATLRALEEGGLELERLEITTCLRRGEIEVATRYEPSTQALHDELLVGLRERHGDTLFSEDGSTIDEQVAALLEGRTVATAESCTGGLIAARLTERPGSSAYVAGGVVAYSNEAKVTQAGVDPALIEGHGAVSPEVARALAEGAMDRFDADVGVGVTGVAGPGGGSEAKPVGYVCLCVAQRGGERLEAALQLPGGRADVRERSVTIAMHMIRRLMRGEGVPAAPGAEPARA
jgi:nicotinamide-nucleotide amidase